MSLHNVRRVALGLRVQVGPLNCSPGLSGKEEAGGRKPGREGKKAGGIIEGGPHDNSVFPRMSGPAAEPRAPVGTTLLPAEPQPEGLRGDAVVGGFGGDLSSTQRHFYSVLSQPRTGLTQGFLVKPTL